jgi:hypothetical protein
VNQVVHLNDGRLGSLRKSINGSAIDRS